MFKYKKRFIISLSVILGIFSVFAQADVPNAPGAYIGAYLGDTNSSVRLSTADNSDNENGFYFSIYDYATSTLFDTIEVDGSNKAYVYSHVTGLTCDKTYKVVAVAYNDDGNSSQSDAQYFNIKSTFGVATCLPTSTLNAPGSYIGVTAIEGSKTSVRVNFKDNNSNEDGFKIIGDINKTIAGNNIGDQVYTNLTDLTCDKTYQIQAVAYKNGVDSQASDTRSFDINKTFNISCDNGLVAKLTWGTDPRDLDAHVFQEDGYHIYYANKGDLNSPTYLAELNIDDTSSFGPEVFTAVAFPASGVYHYVVHQYSGSSTISRSPARVELRVNGVITTFVPSHDSSERYWHVFDIIVDDEGNIEIIEINSFSNTF